MISDIFSLRAPRWLFSAFNVLFMSFTLPALLSVFSLLAISSGVYFLAERIRLPYTVILVATGTFVLVPLSMFAPFDFLREFTLTPELLLYVFLPILIFESAYNIDIRRLFENFIAISALSVISLLVSAVVAAAALFWLLPLIGLPVPFILCFLFGALISATDPVAVLALFKEIGAPRRLTLLFEGESIFNDGTAVALFLVVLSIAQTGWHGTSSVIEGLAMFSIMIVGGVLLGIVLGGLFVKAIDYARSNEFVQIALMIVLAHFTFLLSDYISQHFSIVGHSIHISAIISTTIASIIMGNYGRAKILPHAQEFVEKFWTESAFLANSLVFILIGFIFVSLPIALMPFLAPIVLAVLIVALARAFSIYPIVWILNQLAKEEHIPISWQHLMAWGSLRGALAITMVLLIPDDLVFHGWTLASTPKEFILALTIGCIFATLFLKATTIKAFSRRLGIGTLTELETLEYQEATALIHLRALARIVKFSEKGYIDADTASILEKEHREALERACIVCSERLQSDDRIIGERVLRLYAIGIEKEVLDTLYDYGEANERVYRRVLGKLVFQYEQIEDGAREIDVLRETDGKDMLDRLVKFFRTVVFPKSLKYSEEDQYLYYRTQTILSRSVLNEMRHLDGRYVSILFGESAMIHVRSVYESFLEGSTKKMQIIMEQIPDQADILSEKFARRAILETEARTLKELLHRSMITPKVAIAIQEDIERESINSVRRFSAERLV